MIDSRCTIECLEGPGVITQLAYHSDKAVAAGRGEVAAESDTVDEIEVGIEDFIGSTMVEDFHKQRDDALDDQCVGISLKVDFAIFGTLSCDPYSALTSLDKILRGLFVFREFRESVAEVDDVCVAVHPVGEFGELIHYFILNFIDSHNIVMLETVKSDCGYFRIPKTEIREKEF